MNNRRLRVFLAHSSRDKAPVREIFNLLVVDGFEPWLDEQSLVPGQDWQLEIKKAVPKSDVVAVFLSKSSVEGQGYINKEIAYALDIAERNPEGTIFIVPIQLEECIIPERLKHLHRMSLPFSESDFSVGTMYMRLQIALVSRSHDLGLIEDDEYRNAGFGIVSAKAAPDWVPRWEIGGRYLVRGQNPNGSKYYGTASIVGSENSLKMTTFVGAHAFSYNGQVTETRDSRVLLFEGKGYTVEYSDSGSGIFIGKWGASGVEELVPASPFADTPEDT